jgi:hypothetical protein
MMNDGRNPAAASININIDVVDVLPWVPATASDWACAQIDDSMPGARQDGDVVLCRLGQFDVVRRDRSRRRDGCASADVTTVVADVHLHAGSANALEDGALAQVTAADAMPHLGEDDGDGTHARAADADDVQPLGVDRSRGAVGVMIWRPPR